jgi:SAM-dependent methyltransferase
MSEFVDPYTKQPLREDEQGDLAREGEGGKVVYKNHGGVRDFVHPEARMGMEKDFYDGRYREQDLPRITLEEVREPWVDAIRPENSILLESMGDIRGKRVLLLGNGLSSKELYFLHLGARVVYTDISIEAAVRMHEIFSASELKEMGYGAIEFHAVDGMHLPFPDSSFDVIYGSAFVHHLEDLDGFFSEVGRCLREGGRCRFLDGAYSPVWQAAKGSFLRPLQLYVHKKRGISPEDFRATMRGGYRKEELSAIMKKYGFRKMTARPFLLAMKWLDDVLERTRPMAGNLINLVWGFDK